MTILLNGRVAGDPQAEEEYQSWHWAAIVFLLGPVMFLAFANAETFSLGPGKLIVFWPVNGLLLGAMLLNKTSRWWIILATAIAVEYLYAFGYSRAPAAQAVALHFANPLEVLLAAWLVRIAVRHDSIKTMTRRALHFMVLSSFVAAGIGSFLTATAYIQTHPEIHPAYTWQVWWLADGLGFLVVAPFVITWGRVFSHREHRKPIPPSRLIEGLLMALLLSFSIFFVFDSQACKLMSMMGFPYLIIPVLLWIAFRFGVAGTATAYLAGALAVIWFTAHGKGPFQCLNYHPDVEVLALQIYLFVIFLLIMLVNTSLQDRLRAEQDRQRLNSSLRHTQQMELVRQLSGGIAHDFSNYLTVILTSVELMEAESELPKEVQIGLRRIYGAAERSWTLIRRLLSFSHKLESCRDTVSLDNIILNLKDMIEHLMESGHELEFELHGGGVKILADPHQIEEVILNLVINARDALENGGRIVIQTRLEKPSATAEGLSIPDDKEYVKLVVKDNGPGMSSSVLKRIFEPAFTTKASDRGTGLGLPTVYSIVQQHEGILEVDSHPGEGSQFTIYLPLA